MATCFDVAKYILEKIGETPCIKLQKLIYYSQAWALVWDDKSLFNEKIEAWINGPVIPELYNIHKGKYSLCAETFKKGNSNNLDENEKDTINHVLASYGNKSSKWLSDLSHMEDPWRNARQGLPGNYRGSSEITKEQMAEYYTSVHDRVPDDEEF